MRLPSTRTPFLTSVKTYSASRGRKIYVTWNLTSFAEYSPPLKTDLLMGVCQFVPVGNELTGCGGSGLVRVD
jgi:hypothetical protein